MRARCLFVLSFLGLHLLVDSCNPVPDPAKPPARKVPVVVAPITSEGIPVVSEWLGTMEPWNRVQVVAKVAGELVSVEVDTGDRVEHGALLARIDDVDYVNARDEAAALLQAAEAHLISAEGDADLPETPWDGLLRRRPPKERLRQAAVALLEACRRRCDGAAS